ncbi:MAG: DUF87 domain-containing protein [Gemmatimonadota bacterium]|nr:DUF87 domain-containing protein [Gemmatimonadota bacterium]
MLGRPRRTFSDLLNWGAAVAPGVTVCKDGSMIAAWEVRGRDTESLAMEERRQATARMSQALTGFGDGCAFWVDFRRRPVRGYLGHEEEFSAEALKVLQMERRSILETGGALFDNVIHLSFQATGADPTAPIQDRITAFEAECAAVETRFAGVYSLRRLRNRQQHLASGGTGLVDELVGHLATSASGRFMAPRRPSGLDWFYLDVLIAPAFRQDNLDDIVRINGRWTAVVAIEGYPPVTEPGVLEVLQAFGLEYQWTTRFVCLGRHQARAELGRRRRFWGQTKRSLTAQALDVEGAPVDAHAAAMELDTETATAEVNAGDLAYGICNSTITLTGAEGGTRDDVIAGARRVSTALLDSGFEARVETVNALEAFLGRLPGHPRNNPRRPILSSLNFGDLVPLSTLWQGETSVPCPQFPPRSPPLLVGRSASGEPYFFNLHSEGVGHTLIFGPTGAGKSVLLGLFAASFTKYPNARVVVFDKKRSIRYLTAAIGGAFIPVGPDGRALSPVRGLLGCGRHHLDDWIAAVVRETEGAAPSEVRREIRKTVALLQPGHTLADVKRFVQADEVRSALEPFTHGNHTGIFDADDDGIRLSDWTVFETEDLFSAGPGIAVLALDYLFRMVEAGLDGRPTLILLDEAWAFLGHPLFAERIRSWLKELRKANASVVLATQSVADATASEITPVLIENCPTKIFLPNPAAHTRASRDQYGSLGVTDEMIAIIAAMQPKRHYYVVKPEGRRVVDFLLGPAALRLLGSTAVEEAAAAETAAARDPDFWQSDLRSTLSELA